VSEIYLAALANPGGPVDQVNGNSLRQVHARIPAKMNIRQGLLLPKREEVRPRKIEVQVS
jgi:hypothetical protein